MASTYELAEPQAPETEASEPEASSPDGVPALVLLPIGEAVGVCDLDGACR